MTRSTNSLCIAWLLLVTACAHRPDPAALALAPSYIRRTSPADTLRWPTTESDAATLFGVPILNTVALPTGAREIRVSDWYSMMAGEPTPVLRIVEQNAHVRGELWLIWRERQGFAPRLPARRCSPWLDSLRTCGTLGTAPPRDWQSIAEDLTRLGAWAISTPCESGGSRWTDSRNLNLVRLHGRQLERYSCNAPDRRVATEIGRTANTLYEYVDKLVKAMTPKRAP